MNLRVNTILYLFVIIFAAACNSPSIKIANEQYLRGEYFKAAKTYRALYNKLPNSEKEKRGLIAARLGDSHRHLSQTSKALVAYQNALRAGNPDSTLIFRCATMLHAERRYEDALKYYTSYLEKDTDNMLARSGAEGCKNALSESSNRPSRYIVKPANIFNSSRADFSPIFFDKEYSTLYFTSSSEKATGKEISNITGTKPSDIFISKKNERGEWQRPEPIEGEINSVADEGVCTFSPDGRTIYFTYSKPLPNSDSTTEIYTSTRNDATWSKPQKFAISNDTISIFAHPAVSPDGTYLYFVSDMPGGFGGKDIWRINLKSPRESLENLGGEINTAADEVFPTVRDDSTIYFASNGHPGFGGLDIFKAVKRENNRKQIWHVYNMGQPINSNADDFGITFGKGESGYFSSNRRDSRGFDNIYYFELPELKISIFGKVLDIDDEPVSGAIIRIVGSDGSNLKEVARNDGTFNFRLKHGIEYVMKAGKEGYLNQKQEFKTSSEEEDAEYEVNFHLTSTTKPQTIDNILYDFDQASLRPESSAPLDSLISLLNQNPEANVELRAHTDRIGDEAYNLDLSQRRAKSVADYLTKGGIDKNRLSSTGYGKKLPMKVTKKLNRLYPQFEIGQLLDELFIENLPEEDRIIADQINRRTEIQVIERSGDILNP